WNGTDLSTSFVSTNQLTAIVPASDLSDAGVAYVTVFTGAPGGGSSTASPLFITDSATGVSQVNVGTGVNPTASIPGGTNAAATGSGTLTVAQFSGDPVPTSASIGVFGGGSFFDVNIGSGNTFSSVSITLSGSGAEAYWWNGTTWAAVIVNGSAVTSTGSSITFTIDANSSPTVR